MNNSCSIVGFENLLLATDGSESAEAATQEALNIAKVCSGRLHVISVVEVNPEYGALAPQIVEKAAAETKDQLDFVKNKAEKEGITCDVVAHQGEEPYQFIIDEARKRKVDMIIMGSHGRTGLKRLMMGSVTSRVIGHAPCKVLVVPC